MLSADKRKLFEQLLAKKGIASDSLQPSAGPRRRSAQVAPLSYNQEGLWFLEQLYPGDATYNVPSAVRLLGRLDISAVRRSLQRIVDRHESLRTTFPMTGSPIQRIVPNVCLDVTLHDIREVTAADRECHARLMVEAEARKPFDLATGPPIRAFLIRLGEQEHILAFTLHHIVTDGWSMGVFTEEFVEGYECLVKGDIPSREPLTLQYSDYAAWQREMVAGAEFPDSLSYWRNHLKGRSCTLELPVDHQRPQVATTNGSHYALELDTSLTNALVSLSEGQGVTLFVTMLTGFKTLLYACCQQSQLVVGTPFANRSYGELERLIGYFVNLLPIHTDWTGNPSFVDLLGRVKTAVNGARDHSEVPFGKIVEAVSPKRDPSRHPLFQAEFTLLDQRQIPDIYGYGFGAAPQQKITFGNVEMHPISFESGCSKFDLTALLWQRGKSVTGAFEYNAELFDRTTIVEMVEAYQKLLMRVVEQPQRRLGDLVKGIKLSTSKKKDVVNGRAISSGVTSDREAWSRDHRNEPSPEVSTPNKEVFNLMKRRGIQQLGNLRRRSVQATSPDLIETAKMPGASLPLVVRPAVDGVDLVEWARRHRSQLDQMLLENRALLFRGFDIRSVERFANFVNSASNGELLDYRDRSTPRTTKSQGVYTSTVHPEDQCIHLHNEGTYWIRWATRLFFCCLTAPKEGGATPIADVRKVLRRLAPEVVESFQKRKMMLVRNFNDGFGLRWEEVFQTESECEVEDYCRQNQIEWEWKTGGRLRTRQIRAAIHVHPVTGELVWFNHAVFFHHTSLPPQIRQTLIREYGIDGLPYNTCFGDGEQIEPEVVALIRQAYEEEKVTFAWEAGDVMLVDNMTVAHGREPYCGEREIIVAMTDAVDA